MSKQTRQSRHDTDVHSISDARESHTDEMRSRMIKYSISMGIRMVCLILVFFVEGWMMWVVIAGAVLLPYFAVILANGGSDTSDIRHTDALLDRAPVREIEAPTTPVATEAPGPDILAGEIIEEERLAPTDDQNDNDDPLRGRTDTAA
jgi:low affinity Fe/Cu permease